MADRGHRDAGLRQGVAGGDAHPDHLRPRHVLACQLFRAVGVADADGVQQGPVLGQGLAGAARVAQGGDGLAGDQQPDPLQLLFIALRPEGRLEPFGGEDGLPKMGLDGAMGCL